MVLRPLLTYPTAHKKTFTAAPEEEPSSIKLGDSATYTCVQEKVDELIEKIFEAI